MARLLPPESASLTGTVPAYLVGCGTNDDAGGPDGLAGLISEASPRHHELHPLSVEAVDQLGGNLASSGQFRGEGASHRVEQPAPALDESAPQVQVQIGAGTGLETDGGLPVHHGQIARLVQLVMLAAHLILEHLYHPTPDRREHRQHRLGPLGMDVPGQQYRIALAAQSLHLG